MATTALFGEDFWLWEEGIWMVSRGTPPLHEDGEDAWGQSFARRRQERAALRSLRKEDVIAWL